MERRDADVEDEVAAGPRRLRGRMVVESESEAGTRPEEEVRWVTGFRGSGILMVRMRMRTVEMTSAQRGGDGGCVWLEASDRG